MRKIFQKERFGLKLINFNKYRIYLFIGIVCVVVLLVTITFNLNQNKYSLAKCDLLNNEITNIVGVYIKEDDEYIKSDTIPESGYILNTEESYCRVYGEEDTNISISYDEANKTLSVTPLTARGTKCYLYFYETLNGAILDDNPLQTETPDFSKTAQADCTGLDNCEETNGLYQAEDDDGTTYYFRGSIDNNWVSFAGFYWRIIRINGDGSIRLIYSGDSESGPVETGEATQIGTSAFNEQANDNAYVGYMCGTPGSDTYEETHANINDSTIKTVLDYWYQQNLLSYSDYISTEQGFCGDRMSYIRSGTQGSSIYTSGGGTGTTTTYYGSYIRRYSSRIPTFQCLNKNDLYTINSAEEGNQILVYPIGLITSDEAIYAGAQQVNTSYYLYTNQGYWTISPSGYYYEQPNTFFIGANGWLDGDDCSVNGNIGVRPVINLDKNVTISSGNGTINNPYQI